MICPYCNNHMIAGYIQCRDGVYWSEKERIVAALPPLNKKSLNLTKEDSFNAFSGKSVLAYNCINCKKIIIDYK